MDGIHLQRRAAQLDVLAARVRDTAQRTAVTATVEWKSLAGNRFREALTREAILVRGCADLLDEAAGELAAHARAVQQVLPAASRPAGGSW